MWPRVAPYAAHILGCQARVYTKTVTSRAWSSHQWQQRRHPGTLGDTSLDVRGDAIREYEQWSRYQLASVAECNAEGTKCVNFPNLQQQFMWRPFSRHHNHCTMQLMSSADNERSDTLRRGDLNKYLFMTTQVVKKITIYRFSHGHDIACFCHNSVQSSILLRLSTVYVLCIAKNMAHLSKKRILLGLTPIRVI